MSRLFFVLFPSTSFRFSLLPLPDSLPPSRFEIILNSSKIIAKIEMSHSTFNQLTPTKASQVLWHVIETGNQSFFPSRVDLVLATPEISFHHD